MRFNLIHNLIAVFILFSVVSCDTNEVFGPHPDNIISSNPWVLKRFDYTAQLETLDVGCTLYYFSNNNIFRKTDCEGNEISNGPWEFMYDYSYIKIGPNTFKVISISKKAMNLRYGDVELMFLPVK